MFKSQKGLETLQHTLSSNESLRKETTSKLGAVVTFEVAPKKGNDAKPLMYTLYGKDEVSLKEGGTDKPDISIKISDADLVKLMNGKQSAQKLFMMGKLKIKGNVMKAAFIEQLLKSASKVKAKL